MSELIQSSDGVKLFEDLKWVLTSPNLLSTSDGAQSSLIVADAWCQTMRSTFENELDELGRNPEEIEAFLNLHPKRLHQLGSYFEVLVYFWLSEVFKFRPVYRNQPIQEGKVTAGEFDFLFWDQHRQSHFHWETSIKFYLYHPVADENEPDITRYFGPRGVDRLHLKLGKIFTHQLKLSKRESAKTLLKTMGIEELRSECFVKGMLFYPLAGPDWRHRSAPREISESHLRGWWGGLSETSSFPDDPDTKWIVLSKRYWIPTVLPQLQSDDELLDRQSLTAWAKKYFEKETRAFMVAELNRNQQGLWIEKSRGYITHDQWPFENS